jgi:toxin ParE1/3/4
MAAYRLSAAADADMANIIEFGILRFGLAQVRKYISELEQHLAALAANGSIGRDASEVASGMRRFSFGSHVIFYQPDGTGILIVRILHHSMDVHRHL